MRNKKRVVATSSFVAHLAELFGDGVLVYNEGNVHELVWFTHRKLNPFIAYGLGNLKVFSLHGSSWHPLKGQTGWKPVEILKDGEPYHGKLIADQMVYKVRKGHARMVVDGGGGEFDEPSE